MKNSPYIPSTDSDQKEMLETIGAKTFKDLLNDVPVKKLFPSLDLKEALSEQELVEFFELIANNNFASKAVSSYMGGGAYNHYIPSTVKSMIQRGEFLTSYTPYQPEASQGTLQVGFEFQSMIAQLFDMEVCNAGMYDGPTALAEAALMACRIKRNNTIVIHNSISDKSLEVIKAYSKWQNITMISYDDIIHENDSSEYGCLLVQSPNQYGENLIYAWFRNNDVKKQEEEIRTKAIEVIEFLNLNHLTQELAGNLSGGQKKLLELGRTMMVDAKLVLLDEVGAGVNRTLLKDLGTAIEKLNKEKGYTFCMIEHDMDFIGRLCDPVIVMAEGSVLFEGSVEDAKKDEKVIESYLGRGSKLKDN